MMAGWEECSGGSLTSRHYNNIAMLPEAEFVQLLEKRIAEAKKRQLLAFQEDLADWLNNTLGDRELTSENLIEFLGNGVVVCQLAKLIYEKSKEVRPHNRACEINIPRLKHEIWQTAGRESFFARENVANFLEFCRGIKIKPAVLFESDDLVKGKHPRNITLCLMEVSRVANSVGIEPPGLVKLEEEIEREEKEEKRSQDILVEKLKRHSISRIPSLRKPRPVSAHDVVEAASPRTTQSQPVTPKTPRRPHSVPCFQSAEKSRANRVCSIPRPICPRLIRMNQDITSTPSTVKMREYTNGTPASNFRRRKSNSYIATPSRSAVKSYLPRSKTNDSIDTSVVSRSATTSVTTTPKRERRSFSYSDGPPRLSSRKTPFSARKVDLHSKVLEVTQSAVFPDTLGIEVERLSEGKYVIAGKQVFVRLLKDRHVMVRVGGGWDTLEHFLLRHTANQMERRASVEKFNLLQQKQKAETPRRF